MRVMDGFPCVVACAMVAVLAASGSANAGVGAGAGAGAHANAGASAGAGAGRVAEADVAHHGHASLWGGRLGVWLESGNHGPARVADVTVRLTFSEPPVAGQELPADCLWGGDRVVLCRAGALDADGPASGVALDLRVPGDPAEVVMRVGTMWNGGATDRNHANDEHSVLVPATGDGYVF
ncbi:hypothetical protein [Streptomyces sp. NPDC000410]|uniref:hypothetical protein n=1 Tax=Streptomyces sp. NPDC000410 TaxID=3154254 RepID=UPI00331CF903